MQFTDEWLAATVASLVPPEELARLRAAEGGPVSLWETLVVRRLATDAQIAELVAKRFRLPIADLSRLDPQVRESVPESLVRRFNVLPICLTDSTLEVATANPFDIDAEKMLAFASGREVRLGLASPARIREKVEELYRGEDAVAKLLGGLESDAEVTQLQEDEDEESGAEQASDAPIVRLVDMMLVDGVASRASDIHIEPVEGGVVVRYRIDGVLRQVMKVPRSAGIPLISRIKIMSAMDIADRRRPQDGRARVAVNGAPVDLRVSTLPSAGGEKVVIRILNQRATVLTLEALGLYPDEQRLVSDLLAYKEGILLVTGPTGSGKTTTLYSALRLIQSEGVNIVTVEDPVEYRLGENIVQVQVHEKAGLTFAAALRSILRQDPDVVLVGEIRDQETAQIALQASLTGHLVLSTLHTNDAPNAVTRLVDMGTEAYKIASALRGVVAQRLMRRLCPVCAAEATERVSDRLRRFIPEGTKLMRAVGCPECTMTGYRGRFSIVEVLTMNAELERLIGSGATADLIAEAARANGMRSLFESGVRHVIDGRSTIEELLRVTDIPTDAKAGHRPPAAAAPAGGRGDGRRYQLRAAGARGRGAGGAERPGHQGCHRAAGGRRRPAPAADEGAARARGLSRRRGARWRAGAGPGGPPRAGPHHARPEPSRARRLRRTRQAAGAAAHREDSGHRAHRKGRRGQRGPRLRAGRRRFPDQAVPRAGAQRPARGGAVASPARLSRPATDP